MVGEGAPCLGETAGLGQGLGPAPCSARSKQAWTQELGLPGLRDTPAQGLPTWAKFPWEPTGPKAPSGTLEIQGWRLHAWAGRPGLGQFCQAALLPTGPPSSSLPLGLSLTPCHLGSGAHLEAEAVLQPCPGWMAGI